MKVPNNLKPSLMAAALAAALALPAQAQTAATPQTPGVQPNVTQQQSAPGQRDERLDVRASKLIGMNVRNRQGEDLGNVHDLVLDTQNNRVHYAVLSHGGFFGIGDNLFAFPLSAMQLAPDLNHLLLNVDREALRQAQGFDRNRWPDLVADGYWRDVDRRYGVQRGAVGQQPTTTAGHPTAGATTSATGQTGTIGATGSSQSAAGTTVRDAQTRAAAPAQQLRYQRASEMQRAAVVGSGGDRIGQVDDVIIDLPSGQIRYAILAFDRGWLTQDRLIAMPVDQFRRTARNELQIPHTREQLAQAPSFERNAWPNLNDPQFRAQMERYSTAQRPATGGGVTGFGTPPAPTGATATGETARQTMAGTGGTTDTTTTTTTPGMTASPATGTSPGTDARPTPTAPPATNAAPRTEREVQSQWGTGQQDGSQTQPGSPTDRQGQMTQSTTGQAGTTGMQSQQGQAGARTDAGQQTPAAPSQAGTDARATTTTGTTTGTAGATGATGAAGSTGTQQATAGTQQGTTRTDQQTQAQISATPGSPGTPALTQQDAQTQTSGAQTQAGPQYRADTQQGTTGMQGATGTQQDTTGMQRGTMTGQPMMGDPRAQTFDGALFDRLDTNRDGRISRDEARADPDFHSRFDQIDQRGLGYVTREHFDSYNQRRALNQTGTGTGATTGASTPGTGTGGTTGAGATGTTGTGQTGTTGTGQTGTGTQGQPRQ